MADINERWEDNAPGKYFVDKSCILCNLCSEIAPNNFKESADGDHNIVFKQPENDEESLVQDAMSQCPTESIGENA